MSPDEDKKHRSARSNRCRDCGASTGHYRGCPSAVPPNEDDGTMLQEGSPEFDAVAIAAWTKGRQDVAIEAAADALLAACAVQVGTEPMLCLHRALEAVKVVYHRAEAEQR